MKAVVRDGVSYVEAIDPLDSDRTYTEGGELPAYDVMELSRRIAALEYRQTATDDALQELIMMVMGGDEETT